MPDKNQVIVVQAEEVTPQAWRNGGGTTRELLAWPNVNAWQVRISRADIDADGPFSSFPGIKRWFAVLSGKGVELQFKDRRRTISIQDEVFPFDGQDAPFCRLIDGSTRDLNLMVQGGTGSMEKNLPSLETACCSWTTSHVFSGLYTCSNGLWTNGLQKLMLRANSLLWLNTPSPEEWIFKPENLNDSTENHASFRIGFDPA